MTPITSAAQKLFVAINDSEPAKNGSNALGTYTAIHTTTKMGADLSQSRGSLEDIAVPRRLVSHG